MVIHIAVPGYEWVLNLINQIRPTYPFNIKFSVVPAPISLSAQTEAYIRAMENDGLVDAFVGSSYAATCFETYARNTPVVKVNVTGFDLLSAINQVMPLCQKTAILVNQKRIPQISLLKRTVKIDVVDHVYKDFHGLVEILQMLYNDGYEHVIGSTQVIEQAELLGMTGHYIWSAKSYLDAVDTAVQIVSNQKGLQLYAKKTDLVLQNIQEGVIVTNADGLIEQYNDSAERILQTDLDIAIGKGIKEVLPKIDLRTADPRTNVEQIITAGIRRKLLANISPICSKSIPNGYVVTFQDASEITAANEKLRKNRSCGFVANTHFSDMIGQSPSFLKMLEISQKFAAKESTILLSGETGTGKELLAQSIHNASRRKNAPFVAINCAAMPSDLLESELFGYEEGAFTGAKRGGKLGLFELADSGTIFLDEIGEISMSFQTRLLRVLEQREIMRLGSEKISHVNIRVITATNKDLFKMVQEKKFREDLFYRLNVLEIKIPPLRARKEDIPLFICSFLHKYGLPLDPPRQRELATHRFFSAYDWPGNIRELSNVIERFCALYVQGEPLDELITKCMYLPEKSQHSDSYAQSIYEALVSCGGNREKTARLLGISRSTLWRLIKKYSIDV